MSLIRVAGKNGYFIIRGTVTFVMSRMSGELVLSFSKEQFCAFITDHMLLAAKLQFPNQPVMLLNTYTRLEKPYEFLQLRSAVVCMAEKGILITYRSGGMPSRVYDPAKDDRCPFCADRSSMMDVTTFASMFRQYLCQTCGQPVLGTRLPTAV